MKKLAVALSTLPLIIFLLSLPIAVFGQEAFITTWQTTTANESITIPTNGGTDITDYDFEIDWGDGTVETITGDDPDPSHGYTFPGTYTVSITGTIPYFLLIILMLSLKGLPITFVIVSTTHLLDEMNPNTNFMSKYLIFSYLRLDFI